MQVPGSAVKHLVVTHFHRDHYRGLDHLHDRYTEAQLWVTAAMRDDQFVRAWAKLDPKGDPIMSALHRAGRRVLGPFVAGLVPLKVGLSMLDAGSVRVRALSPSDQAVAASCGELAERAALGKGPIKSQLRGDNRCSVALHIAAYGSSVLLSGDVESAPAQFGWSAILADARHQSLQPAQVIKVPHHGSSGAHHEGMWSRLVAPDAAMLVAPFTSLVSPIPTAEDCRRLKSRGGRLLQAAPSGAAERTGVFDESGARRVVEIPQRVGVVRARKKPNGPWRILLTPPAFEVTH